MSQLRSDPGPATPPQRRAVAPSVTYSTTDQLPSLGDSLESLAQGDDGDGYLEAGQTIEVFTDEGLAPAAPAGAKGAAPVQVLRRHSGMAFKSIVFCAIRVGQKPKVPSPDTGSSNDVLLSRHFTFFTPQPMIDGTPRFGLVVRYLYALQCFPGPNDSFDFGTSPLSSVPAASQTLNPGDFVQYLSGSGQGFTGGGGMQPAQVTW